MEVKRKQTQKNVKKGNYILLHFYYCILHFLFNCSKKIDFFLILYLPNKY